jgi:hypothetical protein
MFFGFFSTPPEPPKVTVFVHGTDLIPKTLIKPLERFVRHKPGMYSLETVSLTYKYAKYLKNLCKYNPETFPEKHAHIFCWSGKLSHKDRIDAAQKLHTELNKICLTYKKNYKTIKLSLITHSHGGNVVLNLASIKEKREYVIDKLILMAIPVQEKTKDFVKDICFKETIIYSTYSTADMIQVLDPQGLEANRRKYRKIFSNTKEEEPSTKKTPLFSERTFCDKHVNHIRVKSGKRSIAHIEFLLPPFTKKLSLLLETAQKHNFSKKKLTFKY